MTNRDRVLADLKARAAPQTHVPTPKPVHIPVTVKWSLDSHTGLADLKAMLFQATQDFRGRWAQAQLPSGLIVGVYRDTDTKYLTVRFTAPLQVGDQQRQDALRLRDLWELKSWSLSKEVTPTERRSTYLEPAP